VVYRGPHGQVFVRGVQCRGPHGQVLVRGVECRGPHGQVFVRGVQIRGPHGQVFVRGVQCRGPHGQVFVRGVECQGPHGQVFVRGVKIPRFWGPGIPRTPCERRASGPVWTASPRQFCKRLVVRKVNGEASISQPEGSCTIGKVKNLVIQPQFFSAARICGAN